MSDFAAGSHIKSIQPGKKTVGEELFDDIVFVMVVGFFAMIVGKAV